MNWLITGSSLIVRNRLCVSPLSHLRLHMLKAVKWCNDGKLFCFPSITHNQPPARPGCLACLLRRLLHCCCLSSSPSYRLRCRSCSDALKGASGLSDCQFLPHNLLLDLPGPRSGAWSHQRPSCRILRGRPRRLQISFMCYSDAT